MGKKIKKNNSMRAWLVMCVIASVGATFGYFVATEHTSSILTSAYQSRLYSGWSIAGAVTAFIICIIATFKVRKWWKIIPVLSLIVCLAVTILAIFTYSFSGYGAN